LILSLGFSLRVETWGLARNGLDMTILAAGTCMVIAAVAQTKWRSPQFMNPLLILGQRSYEVYLTHMFVVFGLFQIFVLAGKPMRAVPALFIAVVLIAAVLGEAVARFYSEPMNHFLRERWGGGANKLGSVIEPTGAAHTRREGQGSADLAHKGHDQEVRKIRGPDRTFPEL
jgi:peptidoglycan/LPS O-acetylase OafA/YrhL